MKIALRYSINIIISYAHTIMKLFGMIERVNAIKSGGFSGREGGMIGYPSILLSVKSGKIKSADQWQYTKTSGGYGNLTIRSYY